MFRLFFLSLLFIFAPVFCLAQNSADSQNINLRGVVMIVASRDSADHKFFGWHLGRETISSGFVIEVNEIATNAHVVWEAEKLRIISYNGDIFSAKIFKIDAKMDLAILKIDGNFVVSDFVRLRSHPASRGENVYAVGHPTGVPRWSVVGGKIESVFHLVSGIEKNKKNFPLIWVSAKGAKGLSGGPLFDANGEVTGIVARVDPDSGWISAVPVDELIKLRLKK